jgi:hypothetical protein
MKSILIVAADGDARAALIRRLEQEDYLVMTAADAGEARECLRGMLPGAIVIDLPPIAARRLVHHLVGSPVLQLIPRLLVVAPLRTSGRAALSAAAAFVRPVSPDHMVRALVALYPRGRWNVPAAPAVQAVHKAERIREAIEVVAAEPPLPISPPPATINLSAALPDRPSARAISVAQSYVIESMQDPIGNDGSAARAAATALPAVETAVALSA